MTGAIYFPEDESLHGGEQTIFDDLTRHVPPARGRLTRQDIEQAVSRHTGTGIDLTAPDVLVARLDHIGRFRSMHDRLTARFCLPGV